MRVELKEGSFSYGRRRGKKWAAEVPQVLKQMSVDIRSGEMLAVAGRSGSGKSTFMQLLKGFLIPTAGALVLDEADPYRSKRPELFDRVGFIFQYPEHQLFSSTVFEDIAFGLQHSGLTPVQQESKVRQSMEAVGLDYETYARRSPFELSGGEKRRAAIAGVVVLEPEVLILDEPTAGLDFPSRTALFELLHRLNTEYGTTILWVSHQLEEIARHAERLLILKQGRFVADGPPMDLLSDPELLNSLGWEMPPGLFIRQMLKEARGITLDRPWQAHEAAERLAQAFKQRSYAESGER